MTIVMNILVLVMNMISDLSPTKILAKHLRNACTPS